MNRSARFASHGNLAAVLGALAAYGAFAELPHAVGIVDDITDRVMLFDPRTGEYIGDLPRDADDAAAAGAFDCEIGPTIRIGEREYPDTVLVADVKARRVVAFDAASGKPLRTLIENVTPNALAYAPDGRLLVAAGGAGVRAYDPGGGFVATRIAADPLDGPANARDVLVRPGANHGQPDLLVADATLDAILRFDARGGRLGVFAKLPSFRFVQQLALRNNGNVLAADTLGNAVYEFTPTGQLVRTIAVVRPRGVFELFHADLLIAGEEGVQVFNGASGARLRTSMPGFPTTAPRSIRYLRCPRPWRLGDMNGDGAVNNGDLDAFVLALADPQAFARQYPGVEYRCAGDANRDGTLNSLDIDPFLALLNP